MYSYIAQKFVVYMYMYSRVLSSKFRATKNEVT